jgi:hypothetical protein
VEEHPVVREGDFARVGILTASGQGNSKAKHWGRAGSSRGEAVSQMRGHHHGTTEAHRDTEYLSSSLRGFRGSPRVF